jgi:predicted nucleotide-binding protein
MTVPLPDVKRPKNEVMTKLKSQISNGNSLVERYENLLFGIGEEKLSRDANKWSEFNSDLLRRSFVDDNVAKSYAEISGRDSDRLKARIHFLESVLARLELVDERITEGSKPSVLGGAQSNQQVFLVHGHDEAANEKVSRFVEKLGLVLVRLSEQPHGGRTLIEKLEDYSDVAFAIAVLTPDDLAAPIDKAENRQEWKPRARQNAIFELGVFVGRLGRGKVCILYKPGVEIPSDYRGVGYVPMGSDAGWKLDLAGEMKKAGIDADFNKAV